MWGCGILFRWDWYFTRWGRLSRRWLRDNVSFLDQYGGQFYCQYEIGASAPIPALDKDGMPYTYREYSILYGLLPVEDALASRGNYVRLYQE